MIPGLVGTIYSLFASWEQDPSISGRTDDYEIVSGYISDRPWFGRGYGTFIPDRYLVLDNAYLQRTADTGYVGLLTFVSLVVFGIGFAAWATWNQPSLALRHLGVTLTATILVATTSAATFDLLSFPTATGVLLVSLGVTPVLFVSYLAPEESDLYAPQDLLSSRLRTGVGKKWPPKQMRPADLSSSSGGGSS